jgi:hypothetical protein
MYHHALKGKLTLTLTLTTPLTLTHSQPGTQPGRREESLPIPKTSKSETRKICVFLDFAIITNKKEAISLPLYTL